MARPSILIVDDHAIVREGLRGILAKDFDVVGALEDGRALVREAKQLEPDVIVLDISMPFLNGIEAIRQLRQLGSVSKIVVLTMHSDVTYATEVFAAGGTAYVLKEAPPEELITAIRRTLMGKIYLPPQLRQDVTPFLLTGPHQTNKSISALTPRQREVLQLLAEGHTSKKIAAILNVSPRTVEFHKYKMMRELGIRTTAQLTRYAMKHGIVPL